MAENLVSSVVHLFKAPNPKHSEHRLEKSWRLRSLDQIREGPTHLAELRASRIDQLRLLSGPEFGQYAFGNSRWSLGR